MFLKRDSATRRSEPAGRSDDVNGALWSYLRRGTDRAEGDLRLSLLILLLQSGETVGRPLKAWMRLSQVLYA